MSKKKLQQ